MMTISRLALYFTVMSCQVIDGGGFRDQGGGYCTSPNMSSFLFLNKSALIFTDLTSLG